MGDAPSGGGAGGGARNAPGLWGTLDNVWPSSVFNSGFNDGRNMNRETDNTLGFDSLSLSSIWSVSAARGSGQQQQHQGAHQDEGDTTWSSLFTENKKDTRTGFGKKHFYLCWFLLLHNLLF